MPCNLACQSYIAWTRQQTSHLAKQPSVAGQPAERLTAASAGPAPRQETNNAEPSGRPETAQPGDAEQTASVPATDTDNRVALLLARPEIQSVSDLAGKEVAIGERQSASSASIRTAIAAAGAAEVQLKEAPTKAINRLIDGEVPAAILTLASPEAAEWFPDVAGFRIFRIPLSPRALKARLWRMIRKSGRPLSTKRWDHDSIQTTRIMI